MKEIEKDELITINGGYYWWYLPGVIIGGLVLELITEGFQKCASDFKEGFESTHK